MNYVLALPLTAYINQARLATHCRLLISEVGHTVLHRAHFPTCFRSTQQYSNAVRSLQTTWGRMISVQSGEMPERIFIFNYRSDHPCTRLNTNYCTTALQKQTCRTKVHSSFLYHFS